jgi:hypothetical protein
VCVPRCVRTTAPGLHGKTKPATHSSSLPTGGVSDARWRAGAALLCSVAAALGGCDGGLQYSLTHGLLLRYLDTCRHMKSCKYVHYEIDPADRHKLTELNKVLSHHLSELYSRYPRGPTMLTVPSLSSAAAGADAGRQHRPDPVVRCTLRNAARCMMPPLS